MIKSGFSPRLAVIGAKIRSTLRIPIIFSVVVGMLLTVTAAPPPSTQNADEQFIQIMAVIDRADALRTSGKADAARAKYLEAAKSLTTFKAVNPLFSPRTVAYRLKEVTDRVESTHAALPEKPAGSEVIKPTAKLESDSASGSSVSGLTLLDPGAEPRSVLRLHVKAGDKQTATMTIKVKMDMAVATAGPGGAPAPVTAIPAITIPMDVTVQSVADNGDITYQSVMGEATLAEDANTPAAIATAMKTVLGGMKGIVTTGVLTSRGASKEMNFKAGEIANAEVQQFVDQIKEGTGNMGAPLPEEAVGVGAKWQLTRPAKYQNFSVDQTATYELVSVDGNQIKTKFTVNIGGKGQTPAAKGAAAAGVQFAGTVTGQTSTDLSKVISPSADMDMHIEMSMQMAAGNTKQPVNVKMDMSMGIKTQ